MSTLKIIDFSKNELGVEGGTHLAQNLCKMQHLEQLKLADCNVTDRGIIAIVSSLDELGTVINLDFSGN